MKFHLQAVTGNVVTGLGPGWVRVNATEYRESLLLDARDIVPGWARAGFTGLTVEDFARMLALAPEIAILGTGARQRFPHPRLYHALTEAGVGLEVMDTAAACRTYNIIAGEGRRVAVGLLIEAT
jgi:uncharacterized protein